MRFLRIFAAVALLSFAVPSFAQEPVWIQRFPTNSPSPRFSTAMAYDSTRGQVVLFGGEDPNGNLGDTWIWDGSNWIQKFPAASPPVRSAHSVAYDAARGQVVLFGGSSVSGILNDSWVWDGSNWTQKFPSSVPPKSWNSQFLAYDDARQQVVMFSSDQVDNFTWVWDGSNWTQKTPNDSPPGRQVFSMAYDAAHQNLLLFGGASGFTSFDDTWTWDGTNWTQQFPATSPPQPRWNSAAAFDAARGNVVLFGGSGPNGINLQGDTWVWDGSNWTNKTPSDPSKSPAPRLAHAMAYDSSRQEVVLFGGTAVTNIFDDTWVWGNPSSTPTPTATATLTATATPTARATATATATTMASTATATATATATTTARPTATATATTTATATATPTPGKLLIGLGDSVAAGYGLGPDGNDNSYPEVVAGEWGSRRGYSGMNFAMSGAVSSRRDCAATDVANGTCLAISRSNRNCTAAAIADGTCPSVIEDELPRALSAKPDIVTLTVGADDIDFSTCMTDFFTGPNIQNNPCLNDGTALANLSTNLKSIFTVLHNANPHVQIYVTEYYDPLPPPPRGQDPCVIYQLDALNELSQINSNPIVLILERRFLRREAQALQGLAFVFAEIALKNLNRTIDSTSAGYPFVRIVPIKQAFSGHDMCQQSFGSAWVFGPAGSFNTAVQFLLNVPFSSFALPVDCPVPRNDYSGQDLINRSRDSRAAYWWNCTPHPTIEGQQALGDAVCTTITGSQCSQ